MGCKWVELGSLAGRFRDLLDQLSPAAKLNRFVRTPDDAPEATFRKRMNFDRSRWIQQVILNAGREIEQVYYLRHPRPRQTLPGRYFRAVERRILVNLLTPEKCQLEQMELRLWRLPHCPAAIAATASAGNGIGAQTKGAAPHLENGTPTVRLRSQQVRVSPLPAEPIFSQW